jgi:two-component system, OmpR family, phosphate regulon sensor histidine kinase PhoR
MPAMFRGLVLRLRRSIALKLTLTLLGFVAISLLAGGVYLEHALDRFAVRALESRLTSSARLLEDEARALLLRGASPAAVRRFTLQAALPTGSRVTLIDAAGRVVGDSEVPEDELPRVENHAGRPEVRAALAGRAGQDLRRSATIGAQLLYLAVPVHEGARVIGVVRLALPLAEVTAAYADLRRVMVVGGLVALVVASGIGLFVAARVTRPVVEMQAIARHMSEGHFEARAPVRSVDEIGALGRALNVMAGRLREKIDDLEHEQQKVTAILDAMAEGVIAVDGHEAILIMNERAREMFGLDAVRLESKPFQEVIRNADLHEVFRATRGGGAPDVRHALRLAHPVPRTVEVTAVPLPLAAGDRGVVMVLHDVTTLRRLEQMRTEFVANVSHELRTPLTAIHGYLETLLGGGLEDHAHARRFLEIVFRHTERLGRLLDDLTDLSNIELGKVTLHLGPLALGDLVDSVLDIMRPRATSRGVSLDVALDPALPQVHADHDRLAQILINLVDNAIKYTPEGGHVTVRGRLVADDRVEVAVVDTGIGIPREELPRITERFYRVDKARSRELGGTGLGLAIVKHLVLAHGGELAIASEVDEGTTVRFTLPVSAVTAA